MKAKKETILKILIPVIMVLIIGAIYVTQTTKEAAAAEIVAEAEASLEFPLTVTSVDLDELAQYELPVIIDFGADECVPCVEMAPVLQTLNAEMQGSAIVQFVDVWKSPSAATGYPVQVIPTQIFVNADGTPYVPSEELGIEFILYADIQTEEHIFTAHQGGLTEEQMRLILTDMGVV